MLDGTIFIRGFRIFNTSVSLSLNFHDVWVGCYWKVNKEKIYQVNYHTLHLYICLVPCVLIHIILPGKWKKGL